MNKPLVIALVAGLVIGVVGVGLVFMLSAPKGVDTLPDTTGGAVTSSPVGVYATGPSQTGVNVVQPSTSTSVEATVTVRGEENTAVVVKDFRQYPGVKSPPHNPNQYYLFGGLDPAATNEPFSVYYDDTDQSFNVSLLTEPLKGTRQDAEQALRAMLGLEELDMCFLNYQVSVPRWVHETYSGNNLGFSFCPGATMIP